MNDTDRSTRAAAGLPPAIARYLDAHDRHDTPETLAQFTPDATVIDEDRTHRGLRAIRTWLTTVSSEYTFTRTLLSAESDDRANSWVVRNRIDGNFPGNTVDLAYRFTLADDLISSLTIAP